MKNKGIDINGGGIGGARGISNTAIIALIFILALTALYFAPNAFPIPMEALGEMTTETEAAPEGSGTAEGNTAQPKKSAGKAAAASDDVGDSDSRPRNARVDSKTLTLYLGESDWNFIGVMTLRFLMNILFAYVLISLIYAREHRIREYSFSFFVSNILIFMVTSLLASVRVRTGFAFGLFAILSILRYRTEQIQIREMTFLFASIILGVINSLATAELTIFAVLWANVILCMFVFICDQVFMGKTDHVLLIYDNTKLLAKDKKAELHEDIKNRFGYEAVKVVIVKMNYLTDSAEVKLVYKRN
jgi:hypothetical protein